LNGFALIFFCGSLLLWQLLNTDLFASQIMDGNADDTDCTDFHGFFSVVLCFCGKCLEQILFTSQIVDRNADDTD
jgi:hypothetical protein